MDNWDLTLKYFVFYCFDKKGFPSGELGDLLKLCLALKIEGLDSVVKPLKRM
ncbi:putative quorum-sensing-regulated virulence factor [Vibrio sp. 10N.222.54.A3]|uniref:putative quorum-sensing-regulated virulence factor n=1 Tax=Vibrio sp. 10N.222.54.A3 TaxID=3229633 RepID=UPI0035570743